MKKLYIVILFSIANYSHAFNAAAAYLYTQAEQERTPYKEYRIPEHIWLDPAELFENSRIRPAELPYELNRAHNDDTQDEIDPKLNKLLIEQSPAGIQRFINALEKNVKTHKLLLLFGEPGMGKTDLAKAISDELGRDYKMVIVKDLVNEYQNSGVQNISRTIQEARQCKIPPVVILDEIHTIVDVRRNKNRLDTDPGAALCQEIDNPKNKDIIFIATANEISHLTPPLRSRFMGHIFKIKNFDERQIALVYSHHFGPEVDQKLIKEAAKLSANFSNRDIKLVTNLARECAAKRDYKISSEDIKNAIEQLQDQNKAETEEWGPYLQKRVQSACSPRCCFALGKSNRKDCRCCLGKIKRKNEFTK